MTSRNSPTSSYVTPLIALACMARSRPALLTLWKDKYPDADATWFDSCCEQIMTAARREFPVIRWTPMREISGDSDFTPVLSRVRRLPFAGTLHFDLYFYDLSDPRAIPVSSKMIPVDNFFYKKVGEIDPKVLTLKDLVEDLDLQRPTASLSSTVKGILSTLSTVV
jgi:hypothetical protein